MTKDITIAEKNKAIAEFMGYERYEDAYGIWFKKEGMIKCMHHKWQDLRYDKSWDWLMPVWYKFRDLRFRDPMHQLKHTELKTTVGYAILYGEIELAHHNLFEAIEWYKNQNI